MKRCGTKRAPAMYRFLPRCTGLCRAKVEKYDLRRKIPYFYLLSAVFKLKVKKLTKNILITFVDFKLIKRGGTRVLQHCFI